MGLAEQQQLLARLYTDTKLRTDFYSDPAAIGQSLGVEPEDIEQLAKSSPQEVGLFAGSLKRKRLGEVKKLLGLTYMTLGSRFQDLFLQFADLHVPQGIKKHSDDAIAFARYLSESIGREEPDPPWLLELVRFESSWIQAWDADCRWLVKRFRYPVGIIARQLHLGRTPRVPRFRTAAIWFRLRPKGRLWFFAVPFV